MLIAHLPAGYILGRMACSKGAVMGTVLAASMLPDLDMFWFHLVDGGSLHHHRYFPHVPGFWVMVAVVVLPLITMFKRQWLLPACLAFAALFLHLLLDTLVGGIMWFWPFDDTLIRLAIVSPTHSHWILSFMAHWSFAVEVMICFTGLFLLLFRKRSKT